MTISKWKGIAVTEAFFTYCGDYIIIDSKFNFLASFFDYGLTSAFRRLYLHYCPLEKLLIWNHTCKNYWKVVFACVISNLKSVTSSIKTFIDGTVFLLVVSSVLRSNISITKTKINGKITHPIIIPMFNFCQFVEYLTLENLIYVHL